MAVAVAVIAAAQHENPKGASESSWGQDWEAAEEMGEGSQYNTSGNAQQGAHKAKATDR